MMTTREQQKYIILEQSICSNVFDFVVLSAPIVLYDYNQGFNSSSNFGRRSSY